MNEFIPKWQKELDIFNKIKPIIILEGNVLDKYQYPGDDNMQSGSILRLTEYLHYHSRTQVIKILLFMTVLEVFTIILKKDIFRVLLNWCMQMYLIIVFQLNSKEEMPQQLISSEMQ